MTSALLPPDELELLRNVFRRHHPITLVKLFGSRAKGAHKPHSDVDLAIWGDVNPLAAAALAADLDELPLPYHYDVVSVAHLAWQTLREHIERVGVTVYDQFSDHR